MNRIFTLLTSIVFSLSLTAQGFYDLDTIQTIEITFADNNWDALLDAEKAGDENYVMAQSISINGEVYDSIGVKYKGNSTYNSRQVKNPFHIELDTYKDHDYQGYTDIKLSNAANDPSFLREVLSYQIIRQYMDAPLSNYANVYVNGTLIGLYSNSESVSKKFVKSRFYSKKNAFIKCNPPEGAGQGTTDYPNLVYLGQDSTSYYSSYELNSDDGWQELIDLCDTLQNNINDIEKILDVNRALWMLALNNVMVNLDSYIGAFAQNYYLYRDNNDRFLPVIWDLNESFGRFSQTGSSSLNTTSSKQQMSHLLHASDTKYPLIKQLLSIPRYKRMYLAHCKTILLENFDNEEYQNTGQMLQNTIDAAVQADNNKFFTYTNFVDNLTKDVTSGGGPRAESTIGITSLMAGRSAYLLGLSDFTQTAPEISDISMSKANPVVNETIFITATIADASNAYMGYRNKTSKNFEQFELFDDGAHGDGAANDGIYGLELTVNDAENQYYIYGENDQAGMFSPRRAEHEYHSFSATYSDVSMSDLVINEFMASNDITALDQDGEFDDWIELYNNSNSALDLEGYKLSDEIDNMTKWAFPAGTSIAANAYLIIWADKDTTQAGLHANFKLSSSGETLFLANSTGTVIDEVSYADQSSDISYGRYQNGTGDFRQLAPTFEAENRVFTSVENIRSDDVQLSAYPNPASEELNLNLAGEIPLGTLIVIYNVSGEIVCQFKATSQHQVDVSEWNTGMYFVRFQAEVLKLMVY